MSSKAFSRVIRGAMNESGLSLRSFAKKCGIDSSYLSKILKGKRNPPSDEETITGMARVINMDPDRLMFVCGRIPSKLLNLFLREDISEILENISGVPPAETIKQSTPKTDAVSEKSFKKPELPVEIL